MNPHSFTAGRGGLRQFGSVTTVPAHWWWFPNFRKNFPCFAKITERGAVVCNQVAIYPADDDGDGVDNDDNNDDHFDWVQQLAIKLQYRSEDERLCDNLTLLSPNTWLRRTIRGQPGQLESCEVRLGLGFADIMRHFCQSGVPLGVIWDTSGHDGCQLNVIWAKRSPARKFFFFKIRTFIG